jgi:pyruvate kinase
MFESMIKSATPTRAEVSDVANAIFEGTDAVMLSEETTLGEYPVQAVSMMALVSKTTETGIAKEHEAMWETSGVVESVGASAVQIAHDIRAKAIFVLTNSGQSVFMVSKNKPNLPIIGMTASARTANQLLLSYACKPVLVPKMLSLADVSKQVREIVKKFKIGVKGDRVVVVAGLPLGKTAETSAVMVEVI